MDQLRRAQSAESIQLASAHICEKFFNQAQAELSPDFFKSRRVALYRALPRELSLVLLETWLAQAGAILHFPKCLPETDVSMEMLEVETHQLKGFSIGPYGVHEPPLKAKPVGPSALDLIIVPGVAFGPAGERIGLGKGYYDRYLPQAPQALRVSLAFDFQLVNSLEQSEWDQPIDWILTNHREVRTNRFEKWKNGVPR